MCVRHWSLSPDLRSAIIISVSLVRTNKGCTRACEVREMAEKKDFDVSDLVEVSNATVHGVVMEVSPVRPSRKNPEVKYFSGKLSDGQKVVRMISFEPKLRPVLDKSREERKPVALVNCKVSESKFESGFEIMTSGRTRVESSPKKFKIDEQKFVERPDVSVKEVMGLPVNELINIVGKVVKVGEVTEVSSKSSQKSLLKQDCTLRDSMGSCRIVLWEKDVRTLTEGKSYRSADVRVRDYACVNYLSMSEGTKVTEIADIGEVVSCGEDISEEGCVVGEIVSVVEVDEYASCVLCKGKVQAVTEVFGECGKFYGKVKMS